MLEILQAKDYKKYYPLFEKLGIQDEIVSVVEAQNNNEVIGYGVYYFKGDTQIICEINCNDDKYLYDGIVRAILFIAFTNNINKAEFKLDDYSLLKELNLVYESDKNISNIIDFFDKCKDCKKIIT